MHAGAWANVDDVVCQAYSVLIVLDDNHCVAYVAEVAKGAQQAFVVSLV